MEEREQKAIVDITDYYVRGAEFENAIASDDLKFSIWIAAFATAAFGFVFVNADKIVDKSWLPQRVGPYFIWAILVLLAAAIIGAALVQYTVNARLYSEREHINLLNAQIARVLSGQIADVGDDMVSNIIKGKYLREDTQAELESHNERTSKLDFRYGLLLRIQISLTGVVLVGLVVIGFR
jgi:hypothetical protein